MLEGLISLLAPHYCINCRRIGSKLCDNCKNNIEFRPLANCVQCGSRLEQQNCRVCQLPYDYIAACTVREGLVQQLIDDFKFHGARAAAGPLAAMLAEQLAYFPDKVVVTHVPTAAAHVRQRGYDHAALLAKQVARRRRLQYQPLLERQRTARQVGASRQMRQQQAHHLYSSLQSLDKQTTYVLVDDIVTTGATVRYAAQALRAAGATKIAVIAVAYSARS